MAVVMPLFVRPDWYDRARCSGLGPDLFFAERFGNQNQARMICDECEVHDECLTFALERNEQHGMWVGAAVRQRRRMQAAARVAS